MIPVLLNAWSSESGIYSVKQSYTRYKLQWFWWCLTGSKETHIYDPIVVSGIISLVSTLWEYEPIIKVQFPF